MSHLGMPGVNGGGSMSMMNNGVNGATPRPGNDEDEPNYEDRLNTYIYDYFLKNEQYECARAMLTSGLPVKLFKHRDGDINGADDMHTDSKDDLDSKRPTDLPPPGLPPDPQGNSFLLDWFGLFWDVFYAHRRGAPPATQQALQYVQHTQHQNRLRQDQNSLLRMPGMMPGMNNMDGYQQLMLRQQANGVPMNGGDLRQKALQNNRNYSQNQQQQIMAMAKSHQQQQQMMQQQMRRDPSEVDMNGQRPRTPSSGDNAPSPSKRPRIDSMSTHPMMMPQGRGPSQQMIDHNNIAANQLLMQGGINPSQLTDAQLLSLSQQTPQVQQKSIQVYAQNLRQTQQRQNLSKPGIPGQGSPMMQPGLDIPGVGPDYYNSGIPMRVTNGGPTGANGNHALQDYQMQLMLLEQQNKKRLLMARQEQDTMQRPDGQTGIPGAAGGFGLPGMSPQGSRNGPSPGPNDQMKRGTPKMGQSGLPGSPMPDGSMPQTRGSPASSMNFGNAMPAEIFQMKNMGDGMGGMGPNGQLMRPPPSSHPTFSGGQFNPQQMPEIQRAQVSRMNPTWAQGPQGQPPLIQQPPPAQQPSQVGTPQQRNNTTMPPPSGVPAGAATNGRPSSPAQPAAPPTPVTTSKANPKKKDAEKKKKPTKKASTAGVPAATPSSEAENPAQTPTPSTPITPVHPHSFHKNEAPTQANTAQDTAAPVATVEQPQPEPNGMEAFNLDTGDGFAMDYGTLSSENHLEGFDFDSFLQDGFDPSDFGFINENGGVEPVSGN